MLQKPLILAVETSSRTGSVALARGDNLLDQHTFSAPLRHSAEIFPAISRLLDRFALSRTQIDQIHLSIGPGSFTGLRIAVTIAKTMALANAVSVVAVNSLDTIAANLAGESIADGRPPERIATILDAKRGQFYAAVYERQTADSAPTHGDRPQAPDYRIPGPDGTLWRKIGADRLIKASAFLDEHADPTRPVHLMGDGLLYHRDRFEADGVHFLDPAHWGPRAENVYALGRQKVQAGRFDDPISLTPLYLRSPQVTLRRTT